MLPGGQQFTMACGLASTASDPVFSTTDLSVQPASYPTPDGSGAIALAPDGTVATGGSTALTTGTEPPDVNVFTPGSTTPTQSYSEGFSGPYGGSNLAPGGLAWGDSTVLAAVMAASTGDSSAPYTYQLRVITYPLLNQSALQINYIQPEPLGSPVSISGELTINGAAASGQTVTITRIPNGGTPVPIGQATTDSNGGFTISDTPPALGTYTYSASFAGDSANAPDTATGTVVISDTAQLTLKGPATVRPMKQFEISGALTFESGASAKGDTITITLINLVSPGDGPRAAGSATQWTVTAGAQGKFSLMTSVPADGSYAYTASYSDPSGLVTAQTTLYITAQG